MAPFNFGKKIRQRSNGSNQGNTSITSNESANTTIDTSRRSTSSTPLNVSGEQLFKNNILSNMLKKNDHRKVSTSSNNNDEGKSNVQRGFSNRSNETNQPKNNYPVADVGNNDVTKTVYNKVNGNNNINGLSSPFSLQSPSFTIVADSDKHSQSKNSTQNKSLPGSKTSGRDPFGAENINKHESPDSSSSAKDIQAIQDNPDLWLTEDDMFMLKPWDRIKLPISPFPRYRHTASNVSITVNNDSDSLISSDLYLIGGLHGNSVYGDTWKLRFTRSSVNNVDILEHFNSFNKGQNDQQNISDTSHDGNLSKHHIESKKYKLACSSTSIKISNQTPPPRVGHASIMCGNAFIVFGGDTLKLNSKGEMDDDIYLFNINTKRWTVPNPVGKRPCGRYGHKISVIQHTEGMKDSSNKSSGGTKLFLFGGQFDDLYFNDLYSFNLASFRKEDSHWDVIKPMSFSPPPMSNHVMCTFDNKLYVFGGETVVGLMNDIFMYDPAINDWKFIVGTAGREQDGIPEPRQEHSCLVYKNLMCVYGGKNAQGIYLSDLWFFNFMSRKWFKFPEQKTQIMDKIKENKVSPNCLEYQPLGRSGHSMSFLQKENKILIMGGDKLDYNTTLDLNDVFAITNDIDFEEIDGEANQHIFGTTVYTFDLTCLKEFIPDIYDFNNDSSLDLLHIPSPPKVVDIPEMEDEAEEEEEEEEEEEKSKDIVQNSTTATKERVVPRGNHIINVSRNSFPMLKNQDKITPTQPGFDIPAEENSQVGKDSAAGVSDFFDNYNDDELSVQLRNSVNSTHLLSGTTKATVIDPDISIGEESDGRELAETLSPPYHMMLEPDTIEYHQTSDMESPIPNRDNIDTRETLTGEKSFSDHDSRHSTELKSSGTEVEEQDSKVVQEKTEKHVPMKKDVVAEHVPKVSPVKKDVVVDQLPEVVQKKKDVVVDQLPKVAPIKKDVVVDQLPKVVQKNKEIAEEPQAPVIAQKQQTVKSIVIPEHNKDKDVAKSVIEPVADSTKSLEEATPSHSEKVVNDHRDNILEEILKLREETFNAAKETSNIIKNLEKQVKKLQRENEKLTNERDSMSHQVDELNMKNMELISSSADLQDSKKNIITAMKLALAQIEKGHI